MMLRDGKVIPLEQYIEAGRHAATPDEPLQVAKRTTPTPGMTPVASRPTRSALMLGTVLLIELLLLSAVLGALVTYAVTK